jgi:hypothetical protein
MHDASKILPSGQPGDCTLNADPTSLYVVLRLAGCDIVLPTRKRIQLNTPAHSPQVDWQAQHQGTASPYTSPIVPASLPATSRLLVPDNRALRSRRDHMYPTDMTDFNDFGDAVARHHDASLSSAGGPPVAMPSTEPDTNRASLLWHWIGTNHFYNSKLWAEEDLARRTTVSDSEIALNKRAIDRYNQARNDATERVDEILLTALGLVDAASAQTDAPVAKIPHGARLNSETAGSIIDRMSIMALKIHAMHAQTTRTDVDEAHRQSSQVKLDRLMQQRADLGACLDTLISDTQAGRAYFKVYRQFKMYNDPRFNPALVAEQAKAKG